MKLNPTERWVVNNPLVSIQKREFLVKVKECEDCNHRNTLEYFEDYNLKRDTACPAMLIAMAEDWPKGPFMDGHSLTKRILLHRLEKTCFTVTI